MTTRSDETRGAACRLATYGTLSPGEPNHHQLEGLSGAWRPGAVRGRLAESGWGAALGYRGLTLDPEGERIAVQLFESKDLPDHWARLDAFEGPDYRRVVARVETASGDVGAFLYVLAPRS